MEEPLNRFLVHIHKLVKQEIDITRQTEYWNASKDDLLVLMVTLSTYCHSGENTLISFSDQVNGTYSAPITLMYCPSTFVVYYRRPICYIKSSSPKSS